MIYEDLKSIKNYKNHDGTYGIEIETETMDPYIVPQFKFWKHDEDHSLRNFGIEYMLKAPLSYPIDVTDALKEFEQKTLMIPFDRNSNSTSVHVHMNMLREEWITLANMFTIYALFENILIRWAGPSRRSNLFCLPMCDAESQVSDIVAILKGIKKNQAQVLWNYDEKSNKYAALNFVPLTIQGSIEFRSFRGDPSTQCIYTWITILDKLLSYAREVKSPTAIIESYRKDRLKLLDIVFEKDLANLLRKEVEVQGDSVEKIISQNFWYAAQIALWNNEWESFGQFKKPETKASKQLDQFCKDQFGKAFKDLSVEDQKVANLVFQANGGGAFDWDPFNQAGKIAAVNVAPIQGFFEDPEPPFEDNEIFFDDLEE